MNLGVTGGIATGKSTVAAMLHERAMQHSHYIGMLSADGIARDLLDPGTSYTRQVLDHFGAEYALDDDDVINRPLLARRIFEDHASRTWLEELLHPPIIEQLTRESAASKRSAIHQDNGLDLMILEIPLLYEAGLERIVDQVVVTRCSRENQIRRIVARRPGITDQDALRQILAQMPVDEKARRADYVIDTDSTIDLVHQGVEELFDRLLAWQI